MLFVRMEPFLESTNRPKQTQMALFTGTEREDVSNLQTNSKTSSNLQGIQDSFLSFAYCSTVMLT